MAITEYMNHKDAIELVKLRIKEDGILWNVATKEYCQLTGVSIAKAINGGVNKHLQEYHQSLE